MKVVILNRVSTDKQNFNRQSEELNTYCKEKGWEVVEEFSEVISGYTSNQLRVGLMEMMMFLQENKEVSKVVCWEVSRVSRKLLECQKIVEELTKLGVSLHIKTFGIDTLKEDKSVDVMGKLFLDILTSFGDMERTMIKERMNSGRNKFIKDGGVLGRKKGSKETNDEFLKKNDKVVRCLMKGMSVRECIKVTDKSLGTIQKVRNMIKEDLQDLNFKIGKK
jgi:DNA invertase Pin-like site-specific DNA recombinase|tara:strand:+ start:3625 stop:4287 length:663 start_codon:yes stop_codon:yes gene_type:complete